VHLPVCLSVSDLNAFSTNTEIMNYEANSLGIQVNWYKTKIQTTDSTFPPGSYVPVADDISWC